MLAAELSHGGWLNFGPFRWSAVDVPRALRAGAGMVTPLALGVATGHLEYGVFAALGARLVLAGGLWQGVLVVGGWAFLRGGQERAALATAYRSLARYAIDSCARPQDLATDPPPAFDFAAVTDPNPLLRAQERYRFLLLVEQAERIRISLAAVARYGSQCTLLEPAASVLDGLAGALDVRRGHRDVAMTLEQTVAAIRLPDDAPWRWAGAALLGELRGAIRILRRLDERDVGPTPDLPARPGRRRDAWRANVTSALDTLMTAAGTSSEAGRHALRLAVVAAIGEIVAQASGLPHGYWIVLTILIVLRPDYASTIFRGVQRAAGTVVGAGLGLATALLLHAGPGVLVAAVGVTMTVAYAVFAVNYLLFAVFLTDFVVTLLALLGQTAEQTVVARLIGTGVGAALALAGYLVWPSWESESAQQKLARLFETQVGFAAELLRAFTRTEAPDNTALRTAARQARRARTDAEASADRLADEPSRPPLTARLAYGLTGIGRRLAHASLTLNAALVSTHPKPGLANPLPDNTVKAINEYTDAIERAAAVVAGALRSLRPPADMPPLRELQSTVYQDFTTDPEIPALPPDGTAVPPLGTAGLDTVLVSATDEYADALDTAADVLRQNFSS
jgi:uncharacterized membrane protein YccC